MNKSKFIDKKSIIINYLDFLDYYYEKYLIKIYMNFNLKNIK